jgi:hypothetical protein
MDSVTLNKLRDYMTPRSSGEPVNAHVVARVAEPQLDFAAMQRAIDTQIVSSKEGMQTRESAEREVPEKR